MNRSTAEGTRYRMDRPAFTRARISEEAIAIGGIDNQITPR